MSMALSTLLSAGLFPQYELVAGDRDTEIRTVIAVDDPRAIAEQAASALVLLGRSVVGADDVDLAVRLAATHGVAGLLMCLPSDSLPRTARALAERCGLALVLVAHKEPGRLAATMDLLVRGPQVPDTGSAPEPELLGDVAQGLRAARSSPSSMVAVLTHWLRCPVGLVDSEGRTLAGEVPGNARPQVAVVGSMERPAQRVVALTGESLLVVHPIQLSPGKPTNLWLVAEVPFASAVRVRTVGQALAMGAWAMVAYLASIAVRWERHDRHREILLARLIEEADAPRRTLIEQATAVGWRLGGAHQGIHIRLNGGQAPRDVLAHRLRAALPAQGVDAELIIDGPGWSLWITGGESGDSDGVASLRGSVRYALLAVEHECPTVRLCAGIGTRSAGTVGLRRSLLEAREACGLAAARNGAGAVEYVGADNVKRLLSSQYATSSQLSLACQLLSPLTADPSGQLVRTLCGYLDFESSATATAAALGVHRNTVLQRLDRIRALLGVELGNADERLALHLAVRLVRSNGGWPPGDYGWGA